MADLSDLLFTLLWPSYSGPTQPLPVLCPYFTHSHQCACNVAFLPPWVRINLPAPPGSFLCSSQQDDMGPPMNFPDLASFFTNLRFVGLCFQGSSLYSTGEHLEDSGHFWHWTLAFSMAFWQGLIYSRHSISAANRYVCMHEEMSEWPW